MLPGSLCDQVLNVSQVPACLGLWRVEGPQCVQVLDVFRSLMLSGPRSIQFVSVSRFPLCSGLWCGEDPRCFQVPVCPWWSWALPVPGRVQVPDGKVPWCVQLHRCFQVFSVSRSLVCSDPRCVQILGVLTVLGVCSSLCVQVHDFFRSPRCPYPWWVPFPGESRPLVNLALR